MAENGSSTLAPEEGQATSPAVSTEEVTPHLKKRRTKDKGKEKAGAKV